MSNIVYRGMGIFAPRTIFIRATPTPLTFAERRAILHALKKQCRIEFFKKLNSPASFLSMTATEKDTKDLIAQSPLKFQLAHENEDDGHVSNLQAVAHPELGSTSTPESKGAKRKTFMIHIFPMSGEKSHQELILDSPLVGPWPGLPDTTSFIAKTLRKSIPDGILKDGLADWETGGQLIEDESYKLKGGGKGKNDSVRSPTYYAERRQLRRELKQKNAGISVALGKT